MRKNIAILTRKGSLCNNPEECSDINIFMLEGDKVVEYENIKCENKSYGNFISVLTDKDVRLLYMDTVGGEFKKLLEKMGVMIKCKHECGDDKFLNRFIFDN